MWVIFSILAALCWAVCNILDKYALTKWVRSPFVPTIMLGIFGLIASVVIYFIYGFSSLSYFYVFLSLIGGILWISSVICYFQAAKIEEISRVISLYHLSPLFVLIFAGIFLGEIFTLIKYLGISLLMIGAILISSRSLSKISLNKAFWWMILSVIVNAGSLILLKYLLNFADYWTIFAYMRLGTMIGLIPIFYIYFPEFINTVREYGKKVIVVMSVNEILNLVALIFITIAASIGYITLVDALSSLDAFFVLLFVVILSIFYPSILKEEIGKSIILQKVVAIALMFIGALLIT